ncbi:MAG: chloride channel protein [Gammaproteobacteria bacterium]|nr:chloride channel protein [Gammaproteobacteria bacterium]
MGLWRRVRRSGRRRLEHLRLRLAGGAALPQLSALGIVSGLLAGAVIIAFRQLIENVQGLMLPGDTPENYEGLPALVRFLLPVGGAVAIGLVYQALPHAARTGGVLHTIERLAYHQGYVPLRNAVAHFGGAALAIITGQSVGREGPSVHLGAACGSQLGQSLQLPNNSVRTLVGCGTAAAIAASFNTPLAGVVFAMEVVMMEYTIAGFAPVILAAVCATTLTRAVYGADPAFAVPSLESGTLIELPWIMVMGLVIGTLAAAFVHLLEVVTRRAMHLPPWTAIGLAGLVTGLCGLAVPQVMGIGYDTVSEALNGHLALWALGALIVVKLVATTVGLGLGLPGGLIGPTLVIGAATGGAMGMIAHLVLPIEVSSDAFYAVVGMGAMMGATLQAPLAALTAMLELTGNPNIIMPGLLALIVSGLTASELYKKESVFLMLMRTRGLDYRNDPVLQSLRRVGVAGAIERRIAVLPRHIDRARARDVLKDGPRWIVIEEDHAPRALLPGADLAAFLETKGEAAQIDLMEVPAKRRELAPIAVQSDLQEAYEILRRSGAGALYAQRQIAPGINRIYGVLTEQDIESAYRY